MSNKLSATVRYSSLRARAGSMATARHAGITEAGEGLTLFLEVVEVSGAKRRALTAVGVGLGDENQAVGVGVGEGAEDSRLEEAEDRSREAHRGCEQEHDKSRRARCPQKAPGGELHLHSYICECILASTAEKSS